MKRTAIVGVLLTAIAICGVAVWRLAPVVTSTSEPPSSGSAGAATTDRSDPLARDPETASDPGSPPDIQPTSRPGPDDPLAARERNMASMLYRTAGGDIVQQLMASGLPQSDSEAIARTYASDVAQCSTIALRVEAERQSISPAELVARLDAAMNFGDLNPSDVIAGPADLIAIVSEVVDVSSMEANLNPCIADAVQRAGLTPDVAIEALPQPFGDR